MNIVKLRILFQDYYHDQHTTRYVKEVYRTQHKEENMIIPDIQRGGFKRVAEFRYFNCKKNRYAMTNE